MNAFCTTLITFTLRGILTHSKFKLLTETTKNLSINFKHVLMLLKRSLTLTQQLQQTICIIHYFLHQKTLLNFAVDKECTWSSWFKTAKNSGIKNILSKLFYSKSIAYLSKQLQNDNLIEHFWRVASTIVDESSSVTFNMSSCWRFCLCPFIMNEFNHLQQKTT